MANTTNFSVRMDSDIKKQCEALYGELGINLTTAINVFLRQSLRAGGFPFEVRLEQPNKETIAAMLEAEEGVKFSVSMGKIFFDKNQICIIVLSKFLVFCCRIIYLIIVLPIRLRLYLNFKIFCSTNNGISNPFSWALPTPGLRNKLGFSGNTINAEGIR